MICFCISFLNSTKILIIKNVLQLYTTWSPLKQSPFAVRVEMFAVADKPPSVMTPSIRQPDPKVLSGLFDQVADCTVCVKVVFVKSDLTTFHF